MYMQGDSKGGEPPRAQHSRFFTAGYEYGRGHKKQGPRTVVYADLEFLKAPRLLN